MSAVTGVNNATVGISVSAHLRSRRPQHWLKVRRHDDELVLVGANLDAANEVARKAAESSAIFGWHRLGWPQLVYSVAAPLLADRGIVPAGRIGTRALVASLIQRVRIAGD